MQMLWKNLWESDRIMSEKWHGSPCRHCEEGRLSRCDFKRKIAVFEPITGKSDVKFLLRNSFLCRNRKCGKRFTPPATSYVYNWPGPSIIYLLAIFLPAFCAGHKEMSEVINEEQNDKILAPWVLWVGGNPDPEDDNLVAPLWRQTVIKPKAALLINEQLMAVNAQKLTEFSEIGQERLIYPIYGRGWDLLCSYSKIWRASWQDSFARACSLLGTAMHPY